MYRSAYMICKHIHKYMYNVHANVLWLHAFYMHGHSDESGVWRALVTGIFIAF